MDIEFELECDDCSSTLGIKQELVVTSRGRTVVTLIVAPCPDCMEVARNETADPDNNPLPRG